jgi:hypothetical protein
MEVQLNRDHWPTNEPKRLAVVLGGGGSLGAYEAGAMTELLYALSTMNQQIEREGDTEPFRLDVLTGASAGGMTASMLARIILYDLGRRADLYRAWVHDIRMDGLLASAGGGESNALLGKGLIRSIAARYLQEPSLDPVAPASFAPDPTIAANATDGGDRELLLALTLTNMEGLDYVLDTRSCVGGPEARYLTTRFSDTALFAINAGTFLSLDWAQVAKSAIACGNFPIGFQPETLTRSREDYPDDPVQLTTLHWPAALTFVDGGLFDNEPLGKAIGLAGRHDPNGRPDPGRLFLLVHPNLNQSAHSDAIKSDSGLLDQVRRLLGMVITENAVSDWVRANKVNVLARWKDEFVQSLSRIVLSTDLAAGEAAELSDNLTHLAKSIATTRAGAEGDRYLREGLRQLLERYAGTELRGQRLAVFGLVLFILDHVSDLQRRERLWFEVIGHDPRLPLAGAQVCGFAGFFDEGWREYDYRRGRLDTWRALSGWGTTEEAATDEAESWWQGISLRGAHQPARAILGSYGLEPLAQQPTAAFVTRTAPEDSEYYTEAGYWRQRTKVPSFPRVEFKDCPADLQEALKDRIVDRVLQALDLHGLKGFLARRAIASRVDDALR